MPGAVRPHDRYALAPAARGTLEQNSCRLSGAGSRVAGSTTDRPRAWHVSEQQWLMRPLARWYQNNVSHELAKYGEFLLCVCVPRLVPGSLVGGLFGDCLAA